MPGYAKKALCTLCQKRFASKAAQEQHSRAKHSDFNGKQAGTKANKPALPPVGSLEHRGIVYSNLSRSEKKDVRERLSWLCHSKRRLNREGYSWYEPFLPDPNPSRAKFAALVIDCEMGGTVGGSSELIQVTIIDFFSGRVLLDSLVKPSARILDWRENVTGINAASMQEAVSKNKALRGWKAARAQLWKFADKDTIIIGQSVFFDLEILRTSHAKIIDTAIVSADAVWGADSDMRKRWGLKVLCEELLGIRIRAATGSVPHDPLEDSLATRELVLSFLWKPHELENWALNAGIAFRSRRRRADSFGMSSEVVMARAGDGPWVRVTF